MTNEAFEVDRRMEAFLLLKNFVYWHNEDQMDEAFEDLHTAMELINPDRFHVRG